MHMTQNAAQTQDNATSTKRGPYLFSGHFEARAFKAEIGKVRDKPVTVRIEMEIVSEGEQKGRKLKYEGKLSTDRIKFTKQHMMAVGWQGKTSKTFADDVMKAALVVPVEVRIAEYEGRQWPSIDRIGSYSAPLEALTADKFAEVDSWFAEVPDAGQPANDGGGSGGGGGLPGDDGDIPFTSADASHDPSPIARSIR